MSQEAVGPRKAGFQPADVPPEPAGSQRYGTTVAGKRLVVLVLRAADRLTYEAAFPAATASQ